MTGKISLENMSINDLEKFLASPRKRQLSFDMIDKVSSLIDQRHKENEILAEKLIDSQLYRLSALQVRKEQKGMLSINDNGAIISIPDPLKVILKGFEILKKADKKHISLTNNINTENNKNPKNDNKVLSQPLSEMFQMIIEQVKDIDENYE